VPKGKGTSRNKRTLNPKREEILKKYVFNRLIQGILTVLFIATATFFAMHLVPGDPLMSDKAMSPEIRANLEARYGLDKPVIVQYFTFLKNMAMGDFGISFTQKNRSDNDIIAEHFPVSAILGILAILYAALGGILWGALTAKFRNKWPDHVIMILVIFGISVPNFVVAALSQWGVVNLNKVAGFSILPVAGWGDLSNMILPALALGLGTMAYLTRLMRTTMLDVTNSDYIRTAKAKGLAPTRIFMKHELRNSVLPLITILGPAIAAITTGGFVVESIFAIPGLGKYFVQAVQQLDYTVIMGLTVFYGGFLVFMVIAVDIIYGFIDPRIRLAK
jgi:ABC-type dipeptide/oligopeptide/nickel transport system permease component